jgi:hypothetical protein
MGAFHIQGNISIFKYLEVVGRMFAEMGAMVLFLGEVVGRETLFYSDKESR